MSKFTWNSLERASTFVPLQSQGMRKRRFRICLIPDANRIQCERDWLTWDKDTKRNLLLSKRIFSCRRDSMRNGVYWVVSLYVTVIVILMQLDKRASTNLYKIHVTSSHQPWHYLCSIISANKWIRLNCLVSITTHPTGWLVRLIKLCLDHFDCIIVWPKKCCARKVGCVFQWIHLNDNKEELKM